MKIPVSECPAGPEMDAVIAEHLGFKIKWFESFDGTPSPAYLAGKIANRDDGWIEQDDWQPVPKYSTDIADAWGLVEEMISRGGLNEGRLKFCSLVAQNGISEFEREPLWNLTAGPATLAICRAFLKANGVEEVEYETD